MYSHIEKSKTGKSFTNSTEFSQSLTFYMQQSQDDLVSEGIKARDYVLKTIHGIPSSTNLIPPLHLYNDQKILFFFLKIHFQTGQEILREQNDPYCFKKNGISY